MEDRKLYSDEAAALVGISAATWRRYCTESEHRRRQAPPADGTENDAGHARPWWWEKTIRDWHANRPGRGRARDPLSRARKVKPEPANPQS